MFKLIFWLAAGVVVYTYFGYPLVLGFLRLVRVRHRAVPSSPSPSVSMVISVFNEEGILPAKIRNIEDLDYPEGTLEVLIGSDGSEDSSNDILQAAASSRTIPVIFPARRGKVSVVNDLAAMARGDILVFCDANNMFGRDALHHLVRQFADPLVGGVCGEQVLHSDEANVGSVGEISYWGYETLIKRMESDIGTLIGATGAIYAIRRSLFRPLPVDRVLTDDLLIPLRVSEAGYQVKYEPRALSFERVSGSVAGEFRRKVRIGASNFSTLQQCKSLLNPRRGFVSFALWSHKVLRWVNPFFFLAAMISSVFLSVHSGFFRGVVALEGIFLLLVLAGWFVEKRRLGAGVLGLPYYFVVANAALFAGLFRFLRRGQRTTWEVVR